MQDGDYKLVASRVHDLKVRLINLEEELSEANDIASSEEAKVNQLRQTRES